MSAKLSNHLDDHQKTDDSEQDDTRSPIAMGYAWASIIISMGFEMVIPIVLGIYADYKWGTKCVFLLIGIALGFFVVIVNFTKLLKSNKLQSIKKTEKPVIRDN